jgi:hypothetical protein
VEGLESVIAALRAAYPNGVSGDEYFALLYVLTGDMSDAGIDEAMSLVFDLEPVVVDNDVAKVLENPPDAQAVASARKALERVGWRPEWPSE